VSDMGNVNKSSYFMSKIIDSDKFKEVIVAHIMICPECLKLELRRLLNGAERGYGLCYEHKITQLKQQLVKCEEALRYYSEEVFVKEQLKTPFWLISVKARQYFAEKGDK